MLFGIALIPLLGFLGGALDYGNSLQVRTDLQNAVDAAALTAASLEQGATDAEHKNAGQTAFDANNQTSLSVTPTYNVEEETVTVSASVSVPTYLLDMLHIDAFDVAVTATAEKSEPLGKACILALDPDKPAAISFNGTTDLEAIECVVHANSKSSSALKSVGASTASADEFCAGGSYSGSAFTPEPHENCSYVKDPFSDMPLPNSFGCDHADLSLKKGVHALSPGVYCGGIELKAHANVTLTPGIYVIKDGPLHFRSQSTLTGVGVKFYLEGYDAVLDLAGGANIAISAPTTGTYAGFAVFQDPQTNLGGSSFIRGGGALEIIGAIYLPTQLLEFAGNGSISSASPFMPLIANNFSFKGNAQATIRNDSGLAGMPDLMPMIHRGGVRLVN